MRLYFRQQFTSWKKLLGFSQIERSKAVRNSVTSLSKDALAAYYCEQSEILPPWVIFPDADFFELAGAWGGFRQGSGEAWLHGTWLPYWHHLSAEQRLAYVEKHQASPLWREYLLIHWAPQDSH
jgi:hypothetical protein